MGTEPSDWVNAVLRGRKVPLEHSLGLLANAMKRQLPQHLVSLSTPAHVMVISAFLDDELEPRLYTIDMAFAPNGKWFFRYTRHLTKFQKAPQFVLIGSGARCLDSEAVKWKPSLHCLIRANGRGRMSAAAVADYLASLNSKVSLKLKDVDGKQGSVGHGCIVAWRYRKRGIYGGGGAHQAYNGTSREGNTPMLPTIVNGMDVNAIVRATLPDNILDAIRSTGSLGCLSMDKDEVNARLAQFPHEPDEKLR
jgi:hypothetical protein